MRFTGRRNAPRYHRTGEIPVITEQLQQERREAAQGAAAKRSAGRQRRNRRLLALGSLFVVVGVAAPVTAYACGFDPINARPVVAKTLAQLGGQSTRQHAEQHGPTGAESSADASTPSHRSSTRTTPTKASSSASTSSTPTSSSPSSSSSSTSSSTDETTSSGALGRFGLPLYDNPKPVADAARISVASVLSQISQKTTLGRIASYPMGQWFVDGHAGFANDVAQVVDDAAAKKSVATLVAYNIPHRDCGAYSAGGASSADAYRSWIRSFVGGLGSHKAIIVIEPDAIGLAPNCLNASQRAERYSLIKYAVDQFEAQGSWAYIDAGNSSWLSAPAVTTALKASGIAEATGFALNTAQSRPDSELIPYGDKVSAAVGGKHYVIDSSRNGVAPKPNNYDWCNPADKGLGHKPTADTGHALLDAFLWIKTPGGSDGSCNGAPGAGEWFGSYAQMLLSNAHLNG